MDIALPLSTSQVGHASVLCFGKAPSLDDWSMNGLQTTKDLGDPVQEALFLRLATAAQNAGVNRIYCPRTSTFNGQLLLPTDYLEKITRPDTSFTLFRGAIGAGMEIPHGSGLFLPTADCPVAIMAHHPSKRVAAAHAGLRELIDIPYIVRHERSRKNGSVIDLMIELFGTDERWSTQVKSVCGIGPTFYTHPVTHPTYGEQNKKIIAHLKHHLGKKCVLNPKTSGNIDPHEIIRSQAQSGVSPNNISHDGTDTYQNVSEGSADHLWWSYRRAKDRGETENLTKRNGILVINPR